MLQKDLHLFLLLVRLHHTYLLMLLNLHLLQKLQILLPFRSIRGRLVSLLLRMLLYRHKSLLRHQVSMTYQDISHLFQQYHLYRSTIRIRGYVFHLNKLLSRSRLQFLRCKHLNRIGIHLFQGLYQVIMNHHM